MKITRIPKITKDGQDITSVETWFAFAPPKEGEAQWVDGRSAKELAKAWFPTAGEARIPEELASLLSSHADFTGMEVTVGTPEARIKLDDFPGETRNADLVLLAKRNDETIVLTIEAKADEQFDMTIGEKLQSAKRGSNIPNRVEHLCKAIFGVTPTDEPSLKGLRYQLLNAIAATLIAAQSHNATKAVFVVHEFATDKTSAERRQANHDDLVAFVSTLSNEKICSMNVGFMVGPFLVPGGKYVPSRIPLFLAKIKRGQG